MFGVLKICGKRNLRHQRIQVGAKVAHTLSESKAKSVKSASFGLILIKFHHSAPLGTPVAWNPAYVSVRDMYVFFSKHLKENALHEVHAYCLIPFSLVFSIDLGMKTVTVFSYLVVS